MFPRPASPSQTVNWSIFLSILLILAGFLTLMIPFLGGIGITIFVGWALIISSVTHFVFAWKSHATGSRLWDCWSGWPTSSQDSTSS